MSSQPHNILARYCTCFKDPGTTLIETKPIQVYTNDNHSETHRIPQFRLNLLYIQIRSNI